MAIGIGASGSAGSGTTSISLGYPASISAGDLLVLVVVNKYPANAPSTPSGWTAPTGNQVSGGAGASGIGSGNVYVTAFFRIADGTESGSVTVTITSGNSAVGQIHRFNKASDKAWGVRLVSGNDTSQDTSYSATATASVIAQAGHVIWAATGINSNQNPVSVPTITMTGLSGGTVNDRFGSTTNQGDDCTYRPSSWSGFTGNANAAPVNAWTWTNATAGATLFIILYEAPQVGISSASSVTINGVEVPSVAVSSSSELSASPNEIALVQALSDTDMEAGLTASALVDILDSSLVVAEPIEYPLIAIVSDTDVLINPPIELFIAIISDTIVEVFLESSPDIAIISATIVDISPDKEVNIRRPISIGISLYQGNVEIALADGIEVSIESSGLRIEIEKDE